MKVSLWTTGSPAADLWLGTMTVIACCIWALVGGEVWRLIRTWRGK